MLSISTGTAAPTFCTAPPTCWPPRPIISKAMAGCAAAIGSLEVPISRPCANGTSPRSIRAQSRCSPVSSPMATLRRATSIRAGAPPPSRLRIERSEHEFACSPGQEEQQDEHHQEQSKKDLGDRFCPRCDAGETECARDHRYDKENESPFEHFGNPLWRQPPAGINVQDH